VRKAANPARHPVAVLLERHSAAARQFRAGGKQPACVRALDDRGQVVAGVDSTRRIRTERPERAVPLHQPGRGRPATKRQVSAEPVTVESLVAGFGTGDWTHQVLRDSSRGE
jgi:hypothetical protein